MAEEFLKSFEVCMLEEAALPNEQGVAITDEEFEFAIWFLACFQVINMLADIDAESDTTGIEFLKLWDSLESPYSMYPLWSEEERALVESIYVKYGVLARNAIVKIGDSAAAKYARESILGVLHEGEKMFDTGPFEKAAIEILRSKPSLTDSQQEILDIIELD